jgi:NADH-dependent peroxiredoxin subunit C
MKKCIIIGIICSLFCSCTKDNNCKSEIENYTGASSIGKSLPDISLNAFKNGSILKMKLSDYKGKWLILFFYPGDFTFVCPTELKQLAEYYPAFKEMGAEVISISTDSAHVHKAWHHDNDSVRKVTFTMASDRSGNFSKLLGIYNDEGFSERATFIINPGGSIVSYEVNHETIGRSADELLRKLQAAVAAQNSHGGMCPAGWKPGDSLIVPEK